MSRTLKIMLLSVALILAGGFLAACGNGHAQVRFVDVCPDGPTPGSPINVDFAIDGRSLATNLAFPSTTGGYLTVSSGNHTVEVRQTGTTTDFVNAPNVNFINHDEYTVFFVGRIRPPQPSLAQTISQVNDDNKAPASGNIKLRFYHASPSGPDHVDVYVVTPGTPITGLSPNISSLAYQQASLYLNVAAASYEIIVTPAGSKSPEIDETPPAFTAGQIRTFVALDVSDGGAISPNLMELADLN